MASVNLQNIKYANNIGFEKNSEKTSTVSNPTISSTPAFHAEGYQTNATVKTSLATKNERKKYNALSNELDLNYRKKLEFALKSGQLLKNNSNDKSSVLDNLYKILTEERDAGLDKITILKE